MINNGRVGHRYAGYRYEVSRVKIEEYAAATGYRLNDVPGAALVAPNMFAACFTVMYGARLLREDAELGGSGPVVHAGQDYDFHRRVASGDVVDCSPYVVDIVDRGRHTYLTLAIECVDAASGAPVVTSRQTIVYLNAAAVVEEDAK
ncbi:FAS1-like dehydratase domain-containing protein [Plantactinospora alkalitolerans]|uniref:FAS1-like dehydratase domain-containing protein n=1 Tax=Plantactinospora alkalitolerans TaxID=2789879 RepID=UPI002B22075C|nr:MaoC family dehydratase N-terminal domain-containing protein [Plantactinospora alkalitolerans]